MEVPGKQEFCNLCKHGHNKSTEADGICTNCDIYMCQGCFNGHLQQKPCKNHILGKEGDGETKLALQKLKPENCKLHNEEIVKSYCRSHDAIACEDCVVVDHMKCEVKFIGDLARNLQLNSDYKNVFSRIQQIGAKKEVCGNQRTQNRNKKTVLVDKAVDEIGKFRKELNDFVAKVEREILDEAQQLSKENEKKMSDLKEKITILTHKISALTDSLDPKSCPDEILFTRLKECKPQVRQVEKMLSEIKDVPTQTEAESQIPKQEQANLSQKSKAQLDTFGKTPALGTESVATKYMPPVWIYPSCGNQSLS